MNELRGPAGALRARNPVLAAGATGIETDTGQRKYGTGRAWNDTPYVPMPGPTKVQQINSALGNSTDFDALIHRFSTAIGRARGPVRHGAPSTEVAAADGIYAEALDLLDDVVDRIRPALEQARAMARDLAVELAEQERVAAEAAAAERMRQEVERRVAAGVQRREAERLAQIEHDVRAELAEAGRK